MAICSQWHSYLQLCINISQYIFIIQSAFLFSIATLFLITVLTIQETQQNIITLSVSSEKNQYTNISF